jgi:hypothetical protein
MHKVKQTPINNAKKEYSVIRTASHEAEIVRTFLLSKRRNTVVCTLNIQNTGSQIRLVRSILVANKKVCAREDFYLLGCNTISFGERQLMFRRIISSPSSGSKSKASKKPAGRNQQAESSLHAPFVNVRRSSLT